MPCGRRGSPPKPSIPPFRRPVLVFWLSRLLRIGAQPLIAAHRRQQIMVPAPCGKQARSIALERDSADRREAALGQKQTCRWVGTMSAIGCKADVALASRDVALLPIGDSRLLCSRPPMFGGTKA